MVKAVVGDETQLNKTEERLSQSGLPSQVGLVVGKLSSALDRGFVFDLIPTPQNDAGEPASFLLETATKDDKNKGSKSKPLPADSPALAIDRDWVAEHARQGASLASQSFIFSNALIEVSRMLAGGVKVIGVYVWVSDSAFKSSTIALCQTLKVVAEAAPVLDSGLDERLLVHIGYSPRRWTCRNCTLSSNIMSSSLRPCDFKMGKVLSSLQSFRCMYDFDFRLPIVQDNASTLSSFLRQAISSHAKELKAAKALVDGKLIINEEQCTADDLHEVQLLLPFMRNAATAASRQKDVTGIVIFRGSVCSYAYSNSKEPISQAVADIKEDIITSLQSRLDIICDEADEDMGPIEDNGMADPEEKPLEKPLSRTFLHTLRKRCSLPFPGRVFVPWLAGTFICDYLQSSETLEVVKDHCVELMAMEPPAGPLTILQPEVEAPYLLANSFWNIAVPGDSAYKSSSGESREPDMKIVESRNESVKSFNFSIIAAIIFVLLSIMVGFVIVR